MAFAAHRLPELTDRERSIADAAEAGNDVSQLLDRAASAAERAGLELARDFYRSAALLNARGNAELVNAGRRE